jgi:predicted nucleic acid-binding protein
VLASVLADDGRDGDRARARLHGETALHAPELIDLEVMSVVRKELMRGSIDERRATIALKDLVEMPMVRYPHLPLAPRIWEMRSNLTPYDAAYVALAELLGAVFITADRALALVPGARCQIEVLRS